MKSRKLLFIPFSNKWILFAILFLTVSQLGKVYGQEQIHLPPPVEWQAPLGMPESPGDAVDALNMSFTGAAPGSQTPVVSEWNRTVEPGESFTLSGENFSLTKGSQLGSDTQVMLWAFTPQGGTLKKLQIAKVSSDLIMASIPSDIPFGIYFVWVQNESGPGAPIILNRAEAEWIGPLGNNAVAGATKRVFGKNLSKDRDEKTSYVYIRSAGSTVPLTACTVTRVEPFAVWFTVPPSLEVGDYDVFVHNGHGGSYGWSQPQTLKVVTPWIRGSTSISLVTNLSDDRSADLQLAINTLSALSNGGTLNLGEGTFPIKAKVTAMANVCIKGAGATKTTVVGEGGSLIFSAKKGNHITIKDLSFKAGVNRPIFYINSGSVGGGDYNQDLLIQNVRFQVDSDQKSTIALSVQAERFEITGCTMEGMLSGAPIDWWIHGNNFSGGRNELDGAMSLRSDRSVFHGRVVIENCLAETRDWPIGPGGSVNYMDFVPTADLSVAVPSGSIWCSRFVFFALNHASIAYSYIAHNTTKNVAIEGNKGEQILFHSSESTKYAQVSSNTERTLTIRTDGAIDNDVNFVLKDSGGNTPISPIRVIPETLQFGTAIDNVAYVVLVDGKGKGQIRRIAAHTQTTITVDKDWRVPPDSTSKFMIDYIYLSHVQYKNNLNGFPAGYVFRPQHIPSSQAIDYDGNTFFSIAERNTNNRTTYGDNLQGYLGGPSYWNEFRDETSTAAYCTSCQINARGGNWNNDAMRVTTLGPLCLGDWVRGGQGNSNEGFEDIVGGWGNLPANKPLIEGSGFENAIIGSTVTVDNYDNVLLRNNSAAKGTIGQILIGGGARPVLLGNQNLSSRNGINIHNYLSTHPTKDK